MNNILPQRLLSKAFKSSSGELAWRLEDVPDVLKTYSDAGYPIEAFEVWIVNDKGQWNGIIPTKDGSEAVCVYDVQPKQPNEGDDFASRTANEIWTKIQEINIESQIPKQYLPWVRYNLYVEKEYESEQ